MDTIGGDALAHRRTFFLLWATPFAVLSRPLRNETMTNSFDDAGSWHDFLMHEPPQKKVKAKASPQPPQTGNGMALAITLLTNTSMRSLRARTAAVSGLRRAYVSFLV